MDNSQKESFFNIEELFFSRTDKASVVEAGNSVFKRVSLYEWDEILGVPHKLVRHPDMPRGVFNLFWKTIQSGNPIGAYVKNRAKDGSFYWVFALAIPIETGYISLRLKPSTSVFELVKEEYKKLLELEKTKSLTPEASTEHLLQALVKLGFNDYRSFMTHALSEELQARSRQVSGKEIKQIVQLNDIFKMCQSLVSNSKELGKNFFRSSLIPLNLTIQASKLNEKGESIAVVATKYTQLIQEIRMEFVQFEEASLRIQPIVLDCMYAVGAAILQSEMVSFFAKETDSGPIDVKNEMKILNDIKEEGVQTLVAAITDIIIEFVKFKSICEQLKTVSLGLEIVRLTGKIEISQLSHEKQQLDHLINELYKFKIYLDEMIKNAAQIGKSVHSISEDLKESAHQLNSN